MRRTGARTRLAFSVLGRPAVAALVALAAAACGRADEPGGQRFVADGAGLLPAESVERMDAQLEALLRATDVELVAATEAFLRGREITDRSSELFERWRIGDRTMGNRGLLLLIAAEEEQVRLEVSYEMEGVLTDAFVSYVEQKQMIPYFQRGLIGEGVEASVELVARRLYERILGRSFDPTSPGPRDIGGYRSGGAGADAPVPLTGGQPPPSPAPDASVRRHFGAQPTPELAWQRFLEFNRRRIKDVEVGLFDESARSLLRGRNSDAGQDDIARLYRNAAHTVRQQGDRAAIVFLDDPNHLLAPWFFRRSGDGWQLDGSMYPRVIGYNHVNQWRFRELDHPYAFAFTDFRFDRNGFAFPRNDRR